MTFTNKKEEIIYFELTTYGRHLLSQGNLKPEFYAFYDDDVLYDVGRANATETNREVKKRIIEDTPYMHQQVCFSDLDRRLYKQEATSFEDDLKYPIANERVDHLIYPIGTCDPISKSKSPFWDIKFLHGEASSSTKTLQDTSSLLLPYKNIPQINFNLEYTIQVKNQNYINEDTEYLDKTSANMPLTQTATDGTYVSIKDEQVLLYVLEQNGFKYDDSFEIEVFIEEEDNKKLIPLRFFDPRMPSQSIIDGILGEASDSGLDYDPSAIDSVDDPRFVEHYFNLRIDKEVPEEDVCSGIKTLKREEIFVDLDYDCLDRDTAVAPARDISIYGTRVTEDDIEDCE